VRTTPLPSFKGGPDGGVGDPAVAAASNEAIDTLPTPTVILPGEFGLAASVMSQAQDIEHQPARRLLGHALDQPVEDQAIGVTRKELCAIDEIEQRHRLAP